MTKLVPTLLSAAALSCSCGEVSKPPPPATQQTLLSSLAAHPAGRVVVATINDEPVYGDCVTRQAEGHGLSREDALQECIDFELLAQAANQPQYMLDEDVQRKGKQELVRAFIEEHYELRSPADLPKHLVDALWKQVKVSRYNHGELREMVSCRVPLKDFGPETKEYASGKTYLHTLYEELKDKQDLTKEDVFVTCYGTADKDGAKYKDAGVHELSLLTFPLRPKRFYAADYHETIFEHGVEGQVRPPIWTSEGWDLLLVTKSVPTIATTYEEAAPELRTALFEKPVYEKHRNAVFNEWVDSFEEAKSVQVYPDRLPASSQPTGSPAAP